MSASDWSGETHQGARECEQPDRDRCGGDRGNGAAQGDPVSDLRQRLGRVGETLGASQDGHTGRGQTMCRCHRTR